MNKKNQDMKEMISGDASEPDEIQLFIRKKKIQNKILKELIDQLQPPENGSEQDNPKKDDRKNQPNRKP